MSGVSSLHAHDITPIFPRRRLSFGEKHAGCCSRMADIRARQDSDAEQDPHSRPIDSSILRLCRRAAIPVHSHLRPRDGHHPVPPTSPMRSIPPLHIILHRLRLDILDFTLPQTTPISTAPPCPPSRASSSTRPTSARPTATPPRRTRQSPRSRPRARSRCVRLPHRPPRSHSRPVGRADAPARRRRRRRGRVLILRRHGHDRTRVERRAHHDGPQVRAARAARPAAC
jgi:hypothetical protein